MTEQISSDQALPDGERTSNQRDIGRWLGIIVAAFSLIAAAAHLYWLGVRSPGVLNLRAYHLLIPIVLVPLLYSGWVAARSRIHWTDIALIAAGVASTAYVVVEGPNMIFRYGVMPTTWDLVAGATIMLIVLELTRRTVGWALVIIVTLLLLYSLFGSYAPGIFVNRSFSWERVVSFLFSMDGLYGIPLGVSSTYIYLFILFGAMLQYSKAGDFYIDLAYSIAGRSRGGPAKVSIFASAMMGTVSGTGIGNVVTTGPLTIPLMKRAGFSPVFAGAVEAVASTGGQIMPPIMGAGAFLMAEFVRIPYGEVVIAAILPGIPVLPQRLFCGGSRSCTARPERAQAGRPSCRPRRSEAVGPSAPADHHSDLHAGSGKRLADQGGTLFDGHAADRFLASP